MLLTIPYWWLYIPALALLGWLTVYKQWLTVSGGLAAFCTGVVLLLCGGVAAFVAPGIFLASGSLLSKLHKHEKEKQGRNAVQVFSNGIVGLACLLVYRITGDTPWLLAFLASFSTSMADSTSSELGSYYKGRTIDILTLKKVSPGISGGVSWQGTVSAVAGAALLTLAIWPVYRLTAVQGALIVITGVAGMLVDSLLGSLLQRKYRLPNGILVEDPQPGAVLVKGLAWCDNNLVNLLSNALTTVVYLILADY